MSDSQNDEATLDDLAEVIEKAKADARAEALADVDALAPVVENDPADIEKADLSEPVRKALEAAEATAAEAIAKADAAEKQAAALTEADAIRKSVEHASGFAALGDIEDIARILRAVGAQDEALVEKAEHVFAVPAERVSKSGLLAEIGSTEDVTTDALAKAKAPFIAAGDSDAVATTKALDADKSLYTPPGA